MADVGYFLGEGKELRAVKLKTKPRQRAGAALARRVRQASNFGMQIPRAERWWTGYSLRPWHFRNSRQQGRLSSPFHFAVIRH